MLPSDVGQHQAPWFFLLPSYWRRRQRDDVDDKILDHLLTATTADKGVAVAISDLRKTYTGAKGVKQARSSPNKGVSPVKYLAPKRVFCLQSVCNTCSK